DQAGSSEERKRRGAGLFASPRAIEASGSRKHARLSDPRHMAGCQKGGSHGEGSNEGEQGGQKAEVGQESVEGGPFRLQAGSGPGWPNDIPVREEALIEQKDNGAAPIARSTFESAQ